MTQKNNLGNANTMDVGSGFASLASGVASLVAASAQARQHKIQRIFLGLQVNQEKLRAREESVFLREKFLQTISSANASFTARGISTGSGAAARFIARSGETLGEDLQAVKFGAAAKQTGLKLQISQSRLAGKTAKALGLMQAGQDFDKAAQSFARAGLFGGGV